MYRKLDDSLGNVLGFRLSGKLTDDELDELGEEIKLTIADVGNIRLLFEFDDLDEIPEMMTVAGEKSIGSRFDKNIDRMACVSDDAWKPWWEKFKALFTTTPTQFFAPEDRQKALDWLRQEG